MGEIDGARWLFRGSAALTSAEKTPARRKVPSQDVRVVWQPPVGCLPLPPSSGSSATAYQHPCSRPEQVLRAGVAVGGVPQVGRYRATEITNEVLAIGI